MVAGKNNRKSTSKEEDKGKGEEAYGKTSRETSKNSRPKSSKYRGVSLAIKSRRRWRASIYIAGRRVYLGNFLDEKEAALAYDAAVIENNINQSKLNFPVVESGAASSAGLLDQASSDSAIVWRYLGCNAADIMRLELEEDADVVLVDNDSNDDNHVGEVGEEEVEEKIEIVEGYIEMDSDFDIAQSSRWSAKKGNKPLPKARFRKKSAATSKYRGVSWVAAKGKWQVHISIDGESKYIGTFIEEKEAAIQHDLAIVKYKLGRSRLNFPSQPPLEIQQTNNSEEGMLVEDNKEEVEEEKVEERQEKLGEEDKEENEEGKRDSDNYLNMNISSALLSPRRSLSADIRPSKIGNNANANALAVSTSCSHHQTAGHRSDRTDDFDAICEAFGRFLIVNAGFTSLQDMLDYASGCFSSTTTGSLDGLLALKGELAKDIGLSPVKAQQLAGRLLSLLQK